jgi:23S rRNA pseudouridine1911/1915/1917 synthase
MDERSLERVPRVTEIIVTAGQQPERIDLFITRSMMRATRNKVQEAIAAGAVTVNGKPTKANYRIRPGDRIEITLMKPPPIELVAQDIPLDIVYEDDDMVIVNKPAGMVTHPGYGNRDGTLVNAMLFHVGGSLATLPIEVLSEESDDEADEEAGESSEEGEEAELASAAVRPGIVHRLDKDTSGLMVVAKNIEAQSALARQFAERTARREYWAVAWGVFEEEEGEIEGNIARDPRDRKRFAVSRREGKYALTRYRVLERFDFATLISLRLATGRTHQIRVHCAHIGHPIFGDATYGGRSVVYPGHGGKHRQYVANLLKLIDRQALHARMLGLKQPTTGEWMEFESELPEDMRKLIEELRVRSAEL